MTRNDWWHVRNSLNLLHAHDYDSKPAEVMLMIVDHFSSCIYHMKAREGRDLLLDLNNSYKKSGWV